MANLLSNTLGNIGSNISGIAGSVGSTLSKIPGDVASGVQNLDPALINARQATANAQTQEAQYQQKYSAANLQGAQTQASAAPTINTYGTGTNYSNQIASLLQSIQAEEQANVPGQVTTPIDVNALNAQAQQAAQSTVNPLYTNYMNEYLQGLAGNAGTSDLGTLQTAVNAYNPNSLTYNTGLNGEAEIQNNLNLQAIQQQQANTLAQNTQAQKTAASTNALTQGNINAQQQNYQLQTGNAQAAKVQAIGQSIGSGNLAASGLGQQQIFEAENARNIADAAQDNSFQYQRDTSNLSTQDTFAQLAQSSLYARQQGETQTKQQNFNLNDYLRQAAANDVSVTQQLQSQQQQAQTATAGNLLSGYLTNAIQNLPAAQGKNMQAYEQAYNPSQYQASGPSAPDISSLLQPLNVGSSV